MEPKIDGRTKEGRAMRNAQAESNDDLMHGDPMRGNVRGTMRQQVREASRSGGSVVIGHNGEQLTRTRKSGIDPFDFPKSMVPQGWEYQWCAVSSYGNAEIMRTQNIEFYQNGWRPVPAERHDGFFLPKGQKGEIVVRGQMLMERPSELCQEARAEDYRIARQQMLDRDQSLMGGKANVRNALPDGFAMDNRYRGTGGDLRMSIDRALDVPAPAHQLAEPGE